MHDLTQFLAFMGVIGIFLAFVVNLAFAIGLLNDAATRSAQGRPVRYVSGFTWFAATIVGSFLVVALYWVVHDSTLAAPHEV